LPPVEGDQSFDQFRRPSAVSLCWPQENFVPIAWRRLAETPEDPRRRRPTLWRAYPPFAGLVRDFSDSTAVPADLRAMPNIRAWA